MHPTCQLQFKAISQQEAASLKYDSRQRSICQLMIQILRNKKCLTKWLSPTSCLCREAAEVSLSAYTTGQESFSPFCFLPSESVEKVDTLARPSCCLHWKTSCWSTSPGIQSVSRLPCYSPDESQQFTGRKQLLE